MANINIELSKDQLRFLVINEYELLLPGTINNFNNAYSKQQGWQSSYVFHCKLNNEKSVSFIIIGSDIKMNWYNDETHYCLNTRSSERRNAILANYIYNNRRHNKNYKKILRLRFETNEWLTKGLIKDLDNGDTEESNKRSILELLGMVSAKNNYYDGLPIGMYYKKYYENFLTLMKSNHYDSTCFDVKCFYYSFAFVQRGMRIDTSAYCYIIYNNFIRDHYDKSKNKSNELLELALDNFIIFAVIDNFTGSDHIDKIRNIFMIKQSDFRITSDRKSTSKYIRGGPYSDGNRSNLDKAIDRYSCIIFKSNEAYCNYREELESYESVCGYRKIEKRLRKEQIKISIEDFIKYKNMDNINEYYRSFTMRELMQINCVVEFLDIKNKFQLNSAEGELRYKKLINHNGQFRR